MKKIVGVVVMLLASCAFGLNLNVLKTRGLTSLGGNQGERIFHDCVSRHFYEIKIVGASVKDSESTYTIRVLPILKGCKGGMAFPYFPGVVETTGIELDPKKGFTCVYVSPLTKWTKDTWKDVGGDWSKGVVNSTIIVELLRDGESKPIKTWTNCPVTTFKKYRINDLKINLKDDFVHWLDDIVFPTIENREWVDEPARIEVGTWKNKIAKR